MNKPIFAWAAMLILGASQMTSTASSPSTINTQRRAEQLSAYKNGYQTFAKKAPSMSNLLESVQIVEAKGSQVGEVAFAAAVLGMEGSGDPTIAQKIIECFNGNKDQLIRTRSAEALLNLGSSSGPEIAKRVLEDPAVEISNKLSLSRSLALRGHLFGYPFLEPGLQSSAVSVRRQALQLLEAYQPYDGKAWNAQGDKIDMGKMKALAEKNPTASERTGGQVPVEGRGMAMSRVQASMLSPVRFSPRGLCPAGARRRR